VQQFIVAETSPFMYYKAGMPKRVLALGATDRTFLESEVRHRKAPRSLSDRCRNAWTAAL